MRKCKYKPAMMEKSGCANDSTTSTIDAAMS